MIGREVIALAGKERGQKFVIVNLDDKFVYLADGKRLKANKSKRKSPKHIELLEDRLKLQTSELKEERVNAKIRKFLKRSKNV